MRLKLSEIAALCGGRLEGTDAEITGFFLDSREAEAGKMFVPICGERTDAHRFIPQIFEGGAAASFSEKPVENAAGPIVYVKSTRDALQTVAAAWRGRFSYPVIGITGSVGKTTTKEMVALAVSAGCRVMKTAGNANSQLGVPLTVCRMDDSYDAAIVEMGMSMPGEMARIAAVARPSLAVMTNIGVSHIEYLKTRENILKEKLHIADFLPVGGVLLVNGDDDLLSALESTDTYRVEHFGTSAHCTWRAVDVEAAADGTHFNLLHDGAKTPVYMPAPGAHNVLNALCAVAVAAHLGVDMEKALAAVAAYEPPAMRQQIFEAKGITVVDDTYNASPDSMRAALDLLGGVSCTGKRYAVLADMLELGDYAKTGHFETGAYAKKAGADAVVAVGTLAKHIAEGFGAGGAWFETNAQAAAFLEGKLRAGDAVLFKGSRGMHTEEILHALFG